MNEFWPVLFVLFMSFGALAFLAYLMASKEFSDHRWWDDE
jgi:hypothetical protein